jgi:hypothetical protein
VPKIFIILEILKKGGTYDFSIGTAHAVGTEGYLLPICSNTVFKVSFTELINRFYSFRL